MVYTASGHAPASLVRASVKAGYTALEPQTVCLLYDMGRTWSNNSTRKKISLSSSLWS